MTISNETKNIANIENYNQVTKFDSSGVSSNPNMRGWWADFWCQKGFIVNADTHKVVFDKTCPLVPEYLNELSNINLALNARGLMYYTSNSTFADTGQIVLTGQNGQHDSDWMNNLPPNVSGSTPVMFNRNMQWAKKFGSWLQSANGTALYNATWLGGSLHIAADTGGFLDDIILDITQFGQNPIVDTTFDLVERPYLKNFTGTDTVLWDTLPPIMSWHVYGYFQKPNTIAKPIYYLYVINTAKVRVRCAVNGLLIMIQFIYNVARVLLKQN